MRGKIGVVGRNVGGVVGVQAAYFDYFQDYGDVVIINPIVDVPDESLDLLVLPGGPDILDGTPTTDTGSPDVFFEFFDKYVLWQYIQLAEMPILGVCRGFQTLNRHFGGRITQHVHNTYSIPRDKLVETITMTDKETFKVNSMHHQAVFVEQLAADLECIGKSKEFLNVEIFHHRSLKIMGVQFHPEEFRPHIVNSFISTCMGN